MVVSIPADTRKARFQVVYTRGDSPVPPITWTHHEVYMKGGPPLFPETIEVEGRIADGGGPYAVDSIPLPTDRWVSTHAGCFALG